MQVSPIFGNSPRNHHLILEHLGNFNECSMVRVDNHEDVVRNMRGYSLPCARYMNEVFLKKCFESVFWINKKKYWELCHYEKNKNYSPSKRSFDCISEALSFVSDNSFPSIVLDIDPDALHEYKTDFSRGLMEKKELKELISYFESNKRIRLFFLAESERFLDEILN